MWKTSRPVGLFGIREQETRDIRRAEKTPQLRLRSFLSKKRAQSRSDLRTSSNRRSSCISETASAAT